MDRFDEVKTNISGFDEVEARETRATQTVGAVETALVIGLALITGALAILIFAEILRGAYGG